MGEGVKVNITLGSQDPPEGACDGGVVREELSCVDLGHALAGDGTSRSLSLKNHASLPVYFSLCMASQLPHNRHVKKLRMYVHVHIIHVL